MKITSFSATGRVSKMSPVFGSSLHSMLLGWQSKKLKGQRDSSIGKDGTEQVHKLNQEVVKLDCRRL